MASNPKKKGRNRFFLWFWIGFFFIGSILLNVYFITGRKGVTRKTISAVAEVIGLDFTSAEIGLMLKDVQENRDAYDKIRELTIDNHVAPALAFDPDVPGFDLPKGKDGFVASKDGKVEVPKNPEDMAFYSVSQLASLIRTRKITSTDLTRMYIARLKKYDPKLECVITLTEGTALHQAKLADERIAKGD